MLSPSAHNGCLRASAEKNLISLKSPLGKNSHHLVEQYSYSNYYSNTSKTNHPTNHSLYHSIDYGRPSIGERYTGVDFSSKFKSPDLQGDATFDSTDDHFDNLKKYYSHRKAKYVSIEVPSSRLYKQDKMRQTFNGAI